MFKNLFKSFAKEEDVIAGEDEVVIDSEFIKKDIEVSFADVLKQFSLNAAKETEIEKMESSLLDFKAANDKIYKKIENLKDVGLLNTPTAKNKLDELEKQEQKYKEKIEELQKQIKESQRIKKLTDEYALKYPGYKFITKDVMVDVMKRYDLVMGEAFSYAKEIPDDALETISQFKDEIKESEEVYKLLTISRSRSVSNTYYLLKPSMTEKEVISYYFGEGSRVYNKKEYVVSNFKMVAPESHFEIPYYTVKKWEKTSYRDELKVNIPIMVKNEDNIFEFNTEEFEKIAEQNREVLDPIACLEVEGGYIIMDAWDEEAEIPEIQNALLN